MRVLCFDPRQVAPQMGIAFAVYETLRRHPPASVEAHATAVNMTAIWPTVAGGAAGVVSKLAVYPLDTIKKRVQAQVTLVDAGA